MKRRVLLLGCLFVFVLALGLPMVALAAEGSEEGEDSDPWGDASIHHRLNVGWEYPSEYVARPLVYSKRVTEFGFSFDYRYVNDYWNEDGELIEGSFKTKKQTFNLFLGMGLSDNWSCSVNWPFVYKKTMVFPESNNYRLGRNNTYGILAEEAVVDFFDHSDPWQLWEAQLPQLGDLTIWTAYQFFRRLDPTTSFIGEFRLKLPTGNDNPRRTGHIRNYLTTGNTDWYGGLAIKQQAWKFAFTARAGYNFRMPADTKYSPGKIDLADEVLGNFQMAFQMPALQPIWDTFAIIGDVNYMQRVTKTTIIDNLDNEQTMDDVPGMALNVRPKLSFTHGSGDLWLAMDIPVMGQNSFLVYSRSMFLPPIELESYDGVGITYSIGITKRWQ